MITEIRRCTQCGNNFIHFSIFKSPRKYCSSKCRWTCYNKKQHLAKKHLNCVICNAVLPPHHFKYCDKCGIDIIKERTLVKLASAKRRNEEQLKMSLDELYETVTKILLESSSADFGTNGRRLRGVKVKTIKNPISSTVNKE